MDIYAIIFNDVILCYMYIDYNSIFIVFQYTFDLPSISAGDKDGEQESSAYYVQRLFFLSMVVSWDPLYICVHHKVRCHRARLSQMYDRLSPAKLTNNVIRTRQ